MNISINCNYARTGVRNLYQRIAKPFQRISHSDQTSVIDSYNKQYEGQNMYLVPTVGYKRIPELLVSFNKKWHPQSQKKLFLQVFSISEWKNLPVDEKQKHSISNCRECVSKHLSLSRAFPARHCRTQLENEDPVVSFSKSNLSSPKRFGKKVLADLNAISQENFCTSFQQVITSTPKSHLIPKPSSQMKQVNSRQIIRKTKKVIQESMDSSAVDQVMANRIS